MVTNEHIDEKEAAKHIVLTKTELAGETRGPTIFKE